jgi:hypothetical protein
MNEPQDPDKGNEKDFSDFARAREQQPENPSGAGGAESSGGSFLRGCGIALGVTFLLLVFVVGACFMSI